MLKSAAAKAVTLADTLVVGRTVPPVPPAPPVPPVPVLGGAADGQRVAEDQDGTRRIGE